jgi:hypothetical protein
MVSDEKNRSGERLLNIKIFGKGYTMDKKECIIKREHLSASEVTSFMGVFTAGFVLSTYLLMKYMGNCFVVDIPGYSSEKVFDEKVRYLSAMILVASLGLSLGSVWLWGHFVRVMQERSIQIEAVYNILGRNFLSRLIIVLIFVGILALPYILTIFDLGSDSLRIFLFCIYFLIVLEFLFKGLLGRIAAHYFIISLGVTLISILYPPKDFKKVVLKPVAYISDGKRIELTENDEVSLLGDQGILVTKDGEYSLHGSYGEIILRREEKRDVTAK